jgi:hypothetical protein
LTAIPNHAWWFKAKKLKLGNIAYLAATPWFYFYIALSESWEHFSFKPTCWKSVGYVASD